MPVVLADYQDQRDAFAGLCEAACGANILLFRGDSGSGKTTLVSACLQSVPDHVTAIPIDLRGGANTLPEIFYRVGSRLAWERMPAFAGQVAALQRTPDVQVDRNWLTGIANHIHVALRVENPADREERRAVLTEAWFADLRAHSGPVLVVFDTYEKAIPDVQDWIAGPFLARAVDTAALRVLIAGQQVPNPHNIAWGGCCAHHTLCGVPEAAHWLPVIEHMQRTIPARDPLSWLQGICHALQGDPFKIMQLIEGLPRKEGIA